MQNGLASQLESVCTPTAGNGVSRTFLCFQNLDQNVFFVLFLFSSELLSNICESVSVNDLE